MRYFLYVGYLYVIVACNFIDNNEAKPSKPAKKMTYSYACLDSAVGGSQTNKAISRTTGLIRDIAVRKKDITVKGVRAVFSSELQDKSSLKMTDGSNYKRSFYGTISYMPGLFGLMGAAEVIRYLRMKN